jgi:hypothetical protein
MCVGSWGRSIHLKTCSRVPSTLALKRPTRRQASRSPLVPSQTDRARSYLVKKGDSYSVRNHRLPSKFPPPPILLLSVRQFNSIQFSLRRALSSSHPALLSSPRESSCSWSCCLHFSCCEFVTRPIVLHFFLLRRRLARPLGKLNHPTRFCLMNRPSCLT